MNKILNGLLIAAVVPAVIMICADNAEAKDKKHKSWLDKEIAEIDKDYHKAIEKLDKSSFSDEQKKVLEAQAEANRQLATEQAQAVAAQKAKNMEERASMSDAVKSDNDNKKVIKEIDEIL